MALEIERQSVEVETLVGSEYAQALLRAETLAPGAGREAVELLMAEAWPRVDNVDVQADRLVIEGSAVCQAVYRQGEASELRGVSARAALSQVLEVNGAQPGMLARVRAEVEHVEAKYENGHIVFLVTCGIRVAVLKLGSEEVIRKVEGREGLETRYLSLDSVRLAAESCATVDAAETVTLPAALDVRGTLMDWAALIVDSAEPDLGGVRVKGRALVQTLLSSGVEGRPAVLVSYPVPIDQLVSLPEWLTEDAFAEAELLNIDTRVTPPEAEGGDGRLTCALSARLRVTANVREKFDALEDLYATAGAELVAERAPLTLCAEARQFGLTESVRGTLLIGENAPGIGAVIATLARPLLGTPGEADGQGALEGLLEVEVLYMPGGSELPASTRSELPFTLQLPFPLTSEDLVSAQVISAEASALMSDRLELKAQLAVRCERRKRESVKIVSGIGEGAPIQRRPGIVVCWPEPGETPWALGQRYAIPAEQAAGAEQGKPLVIRN